MPITTPIKDQPILSRRIAQIPTVIVRHKAGADTRLISVSRCSPDVILSWWDDAGDFHDSVVIGIRTGLERQQYLVGVFVRYVAGTDSPSLAQRITRQINGISKA